MLATSTVNSPLSGTPPNTLTPDGGSYASTPLSTVTSSDSLFPPPPPNTVATDDGSFPLAPPNTVYARSRVNSYASSFAESLSPKSSTPSVLLEAEGKRRMQRNVRHTNFGAVLQIVEEEQPGHFYELGTAVPDNTPMCSEAGNHSPCSQPANLNERKVEELNLRTLDAMLGSLPSKVASPTPSVFGGTQSTCSSEPLYINYKPLHFRRTLESSNLNIVNNVADPSSSSDSLVTVGPGVREHSDWSGEVEAEVKQGLIRLANLANDDHQADETLTLQEHYHFRLSHLLNEGKVPDPSTDTESMAPHNPPHTKVPGPGEPGDPFAFLRNVKSPAPHILEARARAAADRERAAAERARVEAERVKAEAKREAEREAERVRIDAERMKIDAERERINAEREAERRVRDEMITGQIHANKKTVDGLAEHFAGKLKVQERENRKLKDELAELRAEMATMKDQLKGSHSTTKLGDDATGSKKPTSS